MGVILFLIAIVLDFITQGETGFFTYLYIISIIIWVIASSIRDRIKENALKEKKRVEEIQTQQRFEAKFLQDEPKYRHIHNYPPDWLERKYFFNKKYNRTCQKCGQRGGIMHTHHRVPLSKGGDSSEENLILLCENCHEEEHEHMLKRKLTILTKTYERTRKPDLKEQRLTEVNKIRKKLNLPELT